VKAEQSGLWHVNADGTELERLAAPQEPHYDFAAIRRKIISLEQADRDWVGWFNLQQISPVCLSYEAFANHPAGTVIEICRALGTVPPAPETMRPRLAKLSDAKSLEWIYRYKADSIETSRRANPPIS
jgi:trehalose 2-sulfotransferase